MSDAGLETIGPTWDGLLVLTPEQWERLNGPSARRAVWSLLPERVRCGEPGVIQDAAGEPVGYVLGDWRWTWDDADLVLSLADDAAALDELVALWEADRAEREAVQS